MAGDVQGILELNAFKPAGEASDPLLRRRLANLGAGSVLFYEEPIEMVRGEGAWLFAADGTRYLDLYNNVPSVGHCHPLVVEAVSRQIAQLNIHTRYLHENLERYAERLKATLPDDLDNVALACSGSESNDLALRLAMAWTGKRGFVVTTAAYHGNTALVTDVSPSAFKTGGLPDYVRAVTPPSAQHYGNDIAGEFAAAVEVAIADLENVGIGFAGFICDSIFSSDGVYAEPSGCLKPAVEAVHRAGGLYIADEVQPGFGRTGAGMWGFQRHDVRPDAVTMGKPMGNGFPMSGLVTRHELLSHYCEKIGYFNTFGGNPVATAAGLAVLDAIEADGLIDNARTVGGELLTGLKGLQTKRPQIADVRGAGLYLGVEFSHGSDLNRPDAKLAKATINALKDRQILVGAAGLYGNVLKVRPPLCLSAEQAGMFVDALDSVLAA